MTRTAILGLALLTACTSAAAGTVDAEDDPAAQYVATHPGSPYAPPSEKGTISVRADEVLQTSVTSDTNTFDPPPSDALVGVTAEDVLKSAGAPRDAAVRVTLALATTDTGMSVDTGYRPIDHRLVWWIVATGVCMTPIGGPAPTGKDIPSPSPETEKGSCPLDGHHEDNAVYDAITGQFLYGYTYR